MIQTLFGILGLFVGTLFSSIAHAGDIITSSGFTIDLCNLDPVNSGCGGPRGTSAVLQLLEKIATFLLFVMPVIAGVALIIAGYYYILSSGDSEKASRAKTIIKWNAVALMLALFSYAIINFVASLLDNTI